MPALYFKDLTVSTLKTLLRTSSVQPASSILAQYLPSNREMLSEVLKGSVKACLDDEWYKEWAREQVKERMREVADSHRRA